ncbi:MAG: NADH-quinone oxidoreductase subunit J [Chloroflexi bacterium]|nr:NADH-quinone oxidoreductase subunit J [Chloroflexota bacterium]
MVPVVIAVTFWLLAAVAVLGALLVVTVRNIFYAAVALVATLAAVAGLYLTLEADFLAVVQFMIYVGAIAVLIVFAIMMTAEVQRGSRANALWPVALGVGLLAFLGLALAVVRARWPVAGGVGPVSPTVASAADAGPRLPDVLFGTYLLPFELAGVLLLVATIGAIVIARER